MTQTQLQAEVPTVKTQPNALLNAFKDIFVGVIIVAILAPFLSLSVAIIGKLIITAFKFGYGLW